MRGLVLLVLCACSTTIRVSRDDLQAEVANHFPREIDKRAVVFRLSDPEVALPGSLFALRVRVEATPLTGRPSVAGSARVEGQLEYVAAEHAFYLRQPRVTDLDLGPLNRAHLASVARAAIVDGLLRHPLYRVTDPKAIRHLRRARIADGTLLLDVGW